MLGVAGHDLTQRRRVTEGPGHRRVREIEADLPFEGHARLGGLAIAQDPGIDVAADGQAFRDDGLERLSGGVANDLDVAADQRDHLPRHTGRHGATQTAQLDIDATPDRSVERHPARRRPVDRIAHVVLHVTGHADVPPDIGDRPVGRDPELEAARDRSGRPPGGRRRRHLSGPVAVPEVVVTEVTAGEPLIADIVLLVGEVLEDVRGIADVLVLPRKGGVGPGRDLGVEAQAGHITGDRPGQSLGQLVDLDQGHHVTEVDPRPFVESELAGCVAIAQVLDLVRSLIVAAHDESEILFRVEAE